MEEYTKKLETSDRIPKHIRNTVCEEMCHGVEVSNLARMIAKELGETEEFCRDITLAGILHDIGKLKLTKYLYAEDGLLVEQMKYVRQHTAQSYEIIMDAGYQDEIARAVYYHHENYADKRRRVLCPRRDTGHGWVLRHPQQRFKVHAGWNRLFWLLYAGWG